MRPSAVTASLFRCVATSGISSPRRRLSELLGVQFVVVTQEPMMAESAGITYVVTKGTDGVSLVERTGDGQPSAKRRRRPSPAKGEE